MEVVLKVASGAPAGKELPLKKGKFLIGRAQDCQLRAKSDLVSRHHCVILVEETYLGVRDFGSKNGTHVNGERVAGEIELKSGDRLEVGPMHFEILIREQTPVAATEPAQPTPTQVAPAGDDSSDDDISQWLVQSPAQQEASARDTKTLQVEDTDEIQVEPAKPAKPEPEPAAAEQPKPVEVTKPGKRQPGKLPQLPKSTSKDSGSAAADILRNMTRRR